MQTRQNNKLKDENKSLTEEIEKLKKEIQGLKYCYANSRRDIIEYFKNLKKTPCIVCERARAFLCLPCTHHSLCPSCFLKSQKPNECPICRQEIDSYVYPNTLVLPTWYHQAR